MDAKIPLSEESGILKNLLELGGLDVPDFGSVLTDGTVGGELGGGSNVPQALTAESFPVSVL